MSNRRSFIKKSLAASLGAFGTQSLFNEVHAKNFLEADKNWNQDNPNDERYWKVIQDAFTTNQGEIINLNNGGVSPSPLSVQLALEKYNIDAARGPSYYMWRIIDQGREPLRQRLAGLAGTDPEEIAINRNATEALNTIIFGLPLKKGDEVIGSTQDYPNMMNAWEQRRDRDGIVYKQLTFDFPIENDDTIVKAYADAITPNTRIIHVTHVVNWVGQIMPIRKICDMAHKHGIEVVVDGAHSFGLLDFKIPDLNCDYFGTSLHKFLSAPVGSGMMWVKKEKISNIWPLLASVSSIKTDIRKFETIGTRSFCIEQAIGEAINFQEAIGTRRKQERIHYLKKYWAEKVATIPGLKFYTSMKPEFSCAIASFSIEGLTPAEIGSALQKDYKIHTSGFVWGNMSGVRITPHVYTKTEHLDKLVDAIERIAKRA